ncbi:MAG: PASTA domain-containing protein, partial [Akkermansiaceae bacterium]
MNRVKPVRIINAPRILVAVGLVALLCFFTIRSNDRVGSSKANQAVAEQSTRPSLQSDEAGAQTAIESNEGGLSNTPGESSNADAVSTVGNETSGDETTDNGQNGQGAKPLAVPDKAVASTEKVGDVFADPRVDWTDPEQRIQAVARMKEAEERELAVAIATAKKLGLPLREELPDGGLREVARLDDDGEVLYFETKNVNAAISTGANLLQTSPYSLDGDGIMVGVWDGGSVLSTHQEFNEGPSSRVNIRDGAASNYHATHVGGTVGAFGVVPNAKGMAPQSLIESYDWFSDTSEMTAAAAFGLGQLDSKVHLSNHSYGYSYGWRNSNGVWTWTGTGTDQNAYDADFGQYSSMSRNLDSLVYNSPYYVIFWSAGNESNDGPGNGQTCTIGGASVAYDRSIHPQNDGDYSGGFDTIGDHGVAKNLITVGAANDAVSGGQRDPSRSTLASFSSVGPTDDGRIKPDLVANGVGLYSSDNGNNTDYRSLSGTSMSSPNATGSAALLVDLYRDLFDGDAMRGSTLRGLLIHTASDIGNPGPDYTYGWGLVDAKKAADKIQREADFPGLNGIIEGQVSDAQPSETYSFSWDGISPIRATLCWNDPAGTAENTHNDRAPDLVNNLNLKLTAPDGTTHHLPFVMPFVGTWTEASMSQNATTGVNNTDNVEQVLVASPQQAGNWQAEVSYTGGLTNGAQDFSLLISGIGVVGSLSFDADSYSVDEDAGIATITVNRLAGNAGEVSVSYATQNDTAVAGSDYTATSGTLTWADGEDGARTIEIPIINDGTSEPYEETLFVTLSNPSGGIAISGTATANLTIVDDEPVFGVTAPNGNEVLPVNSSFNITWVSSLGGSVQIDLLRGGLLVQTLAASTANDGLFEWSVPASLPNGSGYSIRISLLGGGGQSYTSNGSFTVENLVEVDLYTSDMSNDPGWTLQGNWAYGTPTGGGGQYGNADPTTGNTGSQVIGYNLSGDYENNLGETYATTPAIDCSGISDVQLSFYRWLNVETNQYDNAGIRVSNDGINWTEIWSNSGQVTDSAWSQQTFDISAVADGEATVYIRWVMGSTDGSWQFSGWNIDDVVVSGLGEGSVGPNNPPVVDAGVDQTVMLQGGTPVPGLYYGTVPGNVNVTTPNPQTQILLDVGSQTENSIASNTTEVYTGSIYDADGQISFTEHIDDKVRIWIDGVLVLSNDAWNTRSSTSNLNLAPGWHTIEIRISNGTGGSGPPSGVGIGYDPAGGTAWQTLVDPGDGSFLRAAQDLPGAIANLDGTVSDLDNDPLTTSWSVVSGPGSVSFDDVSVVDTSARLDTAGTYTLRLTANDGKDMTSDEVTITVEPMLLAVPNLVGLPQSAAESALTTIGFTVGNVGTEYSSTVAAGDVISQATTPGTQIPVGSSVDFIVSLGEQMADVPNVVGLSQAAAESSIAGANLAIGTGTGAYSDTVPAGNVISQNPGGGSSIVVGSSVNLVVSLGAQLITVPNVTGLAQASAESTLTGAGLTVGAITTSYNDTVPAGSVISQGPAAGSNVAVGTAITLVVSDGPEPNTPPVVEAG